MKKKRQEILLGLFVLCAAALLGYASFRVGALPLRGGVEVRVLLPDGGGLVRGADVCCAGVKVGRVTRIGLRGARAEVTARLGRGVTLRDGTRAAVRSKSLLGEKYLDILPGPEGGRPLREPVLLTETVPTMDAEDLVERLGAWLGEIDAEECGKLASALSTIVEGNREEIESILRRLDVLLEKAEKMDGESLHRALDNVKVKVRFF